mgnify:CR=1
TQRNIVTEAAFKERSIKKRQTPFSTKWGQRYWLVADQLIFANAPQIGEQANRPYQESLKILFESRMCSIVRTMFRTMN